MAKGVEAFQDSRGDALILERNSANSVVWESFMHMQYEEFTKGP